MLIFNVQHTHTSTQHIRTEYFCPSLEQPINGTLRLSDGTSLNSQATYNCFRGNVLMGDSTRTCTRDGWSGQDPTCTCKHEGGGGLMLQGLVTLCCLLHEVFPTRTEIFDQWKMCLICSLLKLHFLVQRWMVATPPCFLREYANPLNFGAWSSSWSVDQFLRSIVECFIQWQRTSHK